MPTVLTSGSLVWLSSPGMMPTKALSKRQDDDWSLSLSGTRIETTVVKGIDLYHVQHIDGSHLSLEFVNLRRSGDGSEDNKTVVVNVNVNTETDTDNNRVVIIDGPRPAVTVDRQWYHWLAPAVGMNKATSVEHMRRIMLRDDLASIGGVGGGGGGGGGEREAINIFDAVMSIEMRYSAGQTITAMGPSLVSINPLQATTMYSQDVLHQYQSCPDHKLIDLEPHIWRTVEQALRTHGNHTIIATGVSGAGKTVVGQQLSRYLCDRPSRRHPTTPSAPRGDGDGDSASSRLPLCDRVLEYMGNASTENNRNSSRFIKVSTITLDDTRTTTSVKVDVLMLQLERAAGPLHARFHMLKDAQGVLERQDDRADEHDHDQEEETTIDGLLDFDGFLASLRVFNISPEVVNVIQHVLFGIVNLANGDDRGAERWWKIPRGQLTEVLVKDRVIAGNTQVGKGDRSSSDTHLLRGTLCRQVYEALFAYVLRAMNKAMAGTIGIGDGDDDGDGSDTANTKTISILDMFGSENFTVNGLGQLSINWANEEIQELATKRLIRDCKSQLIRHGFTTTTTTTTSTPSAAAGADADADAAGAGAAAKLSEEQDRGSESVRRVLRHISQRLHDLRTVRPPEDQDGRLVTDIKDCAATLSARARAREDAKQSKKPKQQQQHRHRSPLSNVTDAGFTLEHFFGPVRYSTLGWVKDNAAKLPDIAALCTECDLLVELLPTRFVSVVSSSSPAAAASSGTGGGGASLVASRTPKAGRLGDFRLALQRLVDQLESTELHFIWCILPTGNGAAAASASAVSSRRASDHCRWDTDMVFRQLETSGIAALLQVAASQAGKTSIVLFDRIFSLVGDDFEDDGGYSSRRDAVVSILREHVGLNQDNDYCLGHQAILCSPHAGIRINEAILARQARDRERERDQDQDRDTYERATTPASALDPMRQQSSPSPVQVDDVADDEEDGPSHRELYPYSPSVLEDDDDVSARVVELSVMIDSGGSDQDDCDEDEGRDMRGDLTMLFAGAASRRHDGSADININRGQSIHQLELAWQAMVKVFDAKRRLARATADVGGGARHYQHDMTWRWCVLLSDLSMQRGLDHWDDKVDQILRLDDVSVLHIDAVDRTPEAHAKGLDRIRIALTQVLAYDTYVGAFERQTAKKRSSSLRYDRSQFWIQRLCQWLVKPASDTMRRAFENNTTSTTGDDTIVEADKLFQVEHGLLKSEGLSQMIRHLLNQTAQTIRGILRTANLIMAPSSQDDLDRVLKHCSAWVLCEATGSSVLPLLQDLRPVVNRVKNHHVAKALHGTIVARFRSSAAPAALRAAAAAAAAADRDGSRAHAVYPCVTRTLDMLNDLAQRREWHPSPSLRHDHLAVAEQRNESEQHRREWFDPYASIDTLMTATRATRTSAAAPQLDLPSLPGDAITFLQGTEARDSEIWAGLDMCLRAARGL